LLSLKNLKEGTWTQIYTHFQSIKTRKLVPQSANITNTANTLVKLKSESSLLQQNKKLDGQILSRVKSECITNALHSIPIQHTNTGNAGMYITTKDAHTLTDGPTIFLATDVKKIAKFCIQQANIPSSIMTDIQAKLEFNNQLNDKIDDIEKAFELEEEKRASKISSTSSSSTSSKSNKAKTKIATNLMNKTEDVKIQKMPEEIDALKSMVKRASLDDMFIPNKLAHLKKWAPETTIDERITVKPFTSNIDDDTIVSILGLKDVDDSWKILLFLGIGVFTEHKSSTYTEIMKKLADTQRLYLIIADSDYIYGTNYQFCHGYLSKDLCLTQEKTLQALGRIGRNNIQQEYSIRFRDESQIEMLFKHFHTEEKQEVINMNILFNSKTIKEEEVEEEEEKEEEENK